MIERILDALFEREEINGYGRVRSYLTRWVLLRFGPGRGRALYLHRFTGSDWSRNLHDHPKAFVSIGLRGGYVEQTADERTADGRTSGRRSRTFRAPWVRRFEASHIHRILLPHGWGPCWTLVYTGPVKEPWGFYMDTIDEYADPETGEIVVPPPWVPWDVYSQSKLPERLGAVRSDN